MNPVRLNGNSLTLDELHDIVVDRRPVMLEAAAREKVRAARAVVDRLVSREPRCLRHQHRSRQAE